jgi:DNA-binding response OmpR family regulator
LLENCRFGVIAVEDGKSASETFQRSRAAIDVVLLDVVLPQLNGVDPCRRYRHRVCVAIRAVGWIVIYSSLCVEFGGNRPIERISIDR